MTFVKINSYQGLIVSLKSILKILQITPDNALVLEFLDAIMNLAAVGVL